MSHSNDSKSFGNYTAYWILFIMLLSAYLGHTMGLADREDNLQQQKNEQQIEQKK